MIRSVMSLSETGLKRQDNQDAVLAVNTRQAGLFAVADGMGGHYRGDLASKTAIDSLEKWWNGIQKFISSMAFLDILAELEKKIKTLNEDIFQMYEMNGQKGGTTLCLLLIHNSAYAVMNVGDSRAYRYEGGRCRQMTTDDVWENQAHIKNVMESGEIQNSSNFGKLVQALGAQKGLTLPVSTGEIKRKTVFLLCSDGVYKYCKESVLVSRLRHSVWFQDIGGAMGKIRKKVYKNGAGDNLSMIMVLTETEKQKR